MKVSTSVHFSLIFLLTNDDKIEWSDVVLKKFQPLWQPVEKINKTLSETDKQTRAFVLPSTDIFTGDPDSTNGSTSVNLVVCKITKTTMILSV